MNIIPRDRALQPEMSRSVWHFKETGKQCFNNLRLLKTYNFESEVKSGVIQHYRKEIQKTSLWLVYESVKINISDGFNALSESSGHTLKCDTFMQCFLQQLEILQMSTVLAFQTVTLAFCFLANLHLLLILALIYSIRDYKSMSQDSSVSKVT
jgi:hypothetical protein